MRRRLVTPSERDLADKGAPVPYRLAAEFSRNARSFGFGFVAQACSSATNLGLTVLAARVLGPDGLGTMLTGFAAYVLLLGFQRALLTEPLMASAGNDPSAGAFTGRAAVTLAAVTSIGGAGMFAAIGLLVPGQIGRGMLLFVPWLLPALVQDLGRSIVFRDRTRKSVAFSDATWLVTMAAAAPLAYVWHSDWVVVACWGFGAVTGTVVVLRQLRWRPVPLRKAAWWWKSDARRLGRWLGAIAVFYNVASYTTVLLLASILGTQDFGGLRAVQSVFGPLTLLGPALALPGLPVVSRLHAQSPARALALAAEIGALITAVTAAYVGVLFLAPDVLAVLFGARFSEFHSIILPIGLGQVLTAPIFGLSLFLKVEQRGRTLLWLSTLNAAVYLVLTVALGSTSGLSGAAWGAAAAGAANAGMLLFAIRPNARPS